MEGNFGGGNIGEFGERPWIFQIYPCQIFAILKVSCNRCFDSIGIHQCQVWSTSSVHPRYKIKNCQSLVALIFVIKVNLAWHFKATLRQVRGIMPTSSYCTFDNPTLLMNIEQIDDILLGTWPTTCSTWLISFSMATACGLQGLPISHCKSIPLQRTG